MQFHIEWSAISDTGRQRDHNEDSFLADEEGGLWIVADGMGGHNSGEEASQLAVASVHEFLYSLSDDEAVNERLGTIEGIPKPAADLVKSVRYANERVFIEAIREPEKQGMGTTLVALYRDGPRIVLASVGDSRIYRLRQNMLVQITVDHSLLNHLIASKGISRQEAEAHASGKGNVIVRALGMKDTVNVDLRMEALMDGDTYLACSDGLTDMVDDQFIGQTLAEIGSVPEQACDRLVRQANNNGGVDNITVCVLRIMAI